MKYADRNQNRWQDSTSQDKLLKGLSNNIFGRILIKILINPIFSKIGGAFLSTPLSKPMISSFVKKHNIDLDKCTTKRFSCYNNFFTRQLKDEYLNIDMSEDAFISPCDSKLYVSPITKTGLFHIKNTDYTLDTLLKNTSLADEFIGGNAFIFRLTVDDYHRYCYPDNGIKSDNIKIKGVLHTVNPIANDIYPIYKENSREYCTIETENFGKIIIMEVGALLVGKINNHHGAGKVLKGTEKGMFEFGGSTIIVLTQKDTVIIDNDISNNSVDGYETIVSIGERIAIKKALY